MSVYVRAMVLAGRTIWLAGPPDFIDEEAAFKELGEKNEATKKRLAEQDAAIAGAQGGILRAIAASDGTKLGDWKLPAPPAWDGLASSGGRLYVATIDGRVICLQGR
jgi:hypothetical protein